MEKQKLSSYSVNYFKLHYACYSGGSFTGNIPNLRASVGAIKFAAFGFKFPFQFVELYNILVRKVYMNLFNQSITMKNHLHFVITLMQVFW